MSFFCVILRRNLFHSVVLVHRSAAWFCSVVLSHRSLASFSFQIVPFCHSHMSSGRAREYWYALEFDRTPRWVSSGECQSLRSICQVHRDCSSLILGVVLLRVPFFCVVLVRHSPLESFHSVVLVHRSAASPCYVVPICRSVVLSRHTTAFFFHRFERLDWV